MIQLSNRKTTILSALVFVLAAQLNINIIVHGFTISMSIVFFILLAFLLIDFRPLLTTVLAAPFMIITRGLIEWISGADFFDTIIKYMPEVIFILLYGALFSYYFRKIAFRPFHVMKFLPLVGIDFCSNMVEILIRLGSDGLTVSVFTTLLLIAIGRTMIAIIFVAILDYYGNYMMRKEEQLRYKNLLLLIADLKSEMIWMNKNTSDIENVTANAYEIYQYIKETGNHEYQEKSLELAKDIHEIKKEYFLIMRGINEALAEEDETDKMKVSYLLQLLQESLTEHYRRQKELLQINIECGWDFTTDKPYFLLSILRNLVTNAIEAGDGEVIVTIRVSEENDSAIFEIEDNCGGIINGNMSEIFKPGFSTKIDYEKGSTGRGLGLCIVKDLVETKLQGRIEVQNTDLGSLFIIKIPKEEVVC